MKWRELVLCVLPFGMPAIARAQRATKVWCVGLLAVRHEAALQAAFVRGMRERGYSEGRNLLIEARSAEGRPERLAGPAEKATTGSAVQGPRAPRFSRESGSGWRGVWRSGIKGEPAGRRTAAEPNALPA